MWSPEGRSLRAALHGEPPAVTDAEATELLYVMLGAGGQGYHALTFYPHARREVKWIPVSDRITFVGLVPELAWESDAELRPVPLADEGSFRLEARAGCVWARTDTGAATARLRRFRPLPTLVLREAATIRYTALWAVRKPLAPDDAERVGRHLAHRLGSPKKYAAPSFGFRPPGGVIRHGRKRPCPIVVAGGTERAYPIAEICSSLPRHIPDPDAWKTGKWARRESASGATSKKATSPNAGSGPDHSNTATRNSRAQTAFPSELTD